MANNNLPGRPTVADFHEDFVKILRHLFEEKIKLNPTEVTDIVTLVWMLKESILHSASCSSNQCTVVDWSREFDCRVWRNRFEYTSYLFQRGILNPDSNNLGKNHFEFIKLVIENHLKTCLLGCEINICKIYHVARYQFICEKENNCKLCWHGHDSSTNHEVTSCALCCVLKQAKILRDSMVLNLTIDINFHNFRLSTNLVHRERISSDSTYRQNMVMLKPSCHQGESNQLYSKPCQIYNYDVERKLSSGGFATVYGSVTIDGLIPIVRKKIDLNKINESKRVSVATNTIREIESIRHLENENVVKFFGAKATENRTEIVMNIFMERMFCSLRHFIENDPLYYQAGIESGKVRHLLGQICSGLKCLHSNGIWHMDIKTENLLVDARAVTLKLTDFNLVRIIKIDGGRYRVGGTMAFIAPELIQKWPCCFNSKVDVFSAGCCIIEMLSGGPPRAFFGVQDNETLKTCIKEYTGLYLLPSFRMYLPWEKALYEKMLAIDPDDRISLENISQTLQDPSRYLLEKSRHAAGTRSVDIFFWGNGKSKVHWMHSVALKTITKTMDELASELDEKLPTWRGWYPDNTYQICAYDHAQRRIYPWQNNIEKNGAFIVLPNALSASYIMEWESSYMSESSSRCQEKNENNMHESLLILRKSQQDVSMKTIS